MKFSAVFAALVASAVTADAYRFGHDNSVGHAARHHDISLLQRAPSALEKKQRKRCRARPSGARVAEASSTPPPAPSSTKAPAPSPEAPKPTTEKENPPAPKPTEKANENNHAKPDGGSGGKTANYNSACGPSRAEAKPSKLSGPNGHIDVLTCGIDGAGWNPPNLNLGNVVYVSLDEALARPDSAFQACRPYVGIMKEAAAKYQVPAIMIASIAMQESSCNRNTVGGGGEQGLMQITKEKCGGAPGGDCKEPWFNINVGAKFFADRVAAHGGNLLLAIGSYNGWVPKMNIDYATRARHSSCCRCQNNLDYLHQFFNGWCQGVNAYSANMKKYDNLAVCG